MYHVVIVDDEKIMRTGIASYLQQYAKAFCIDEVFADGAEVLPYMENHDVDLLITDIRMTRLSGLELAGIVSERWPACRIILISGYSEFAYAKEAMRYGVVSYILKPIDFDELDECLDVARRALDRSRALTAHAIDLSNENATFFLTYIMTGVFRGQKGIAEAAERLGIPFSPLQPVGIIDCELAKNGNARQLEQEELRMVLLNVLKMKLDGLPVFPIFKRDAHFFFAVIGQAQHRLSNTSDIEDEIETLFGMSFRCEPLFSAESCFSLASVATEDFVRMLRETLSPWEAQRDNAAEAESSNPEKEKLVNDIKAFIDTHYTNDISREDVAKVMFLSPSYLSRVFKAGTGMSFIDYITMVRMKKAIELVGTHMKVQDIAEKVGYHSRNTFLVNFRNYTSYTPTEYRKKVIKLEGEYEDE